MRVGVVDNRPWAMRTDNDARGVEPTLVRQFAEELNARPTWIWGNEHQLMSALELFELDLVIGGIVNSSPWSSKVAFTRPYIVSRKLIGFPSSIPPPPKIEGLRVAVRLGDPAAAHLKGKGAAASRVEDLFNGTTSPVAALEWELELHGFVSPGIELHREEQVMAVPPGENRWLSRLDEFLQAHKASVKQLIMEEMQDNEDP